MMMERSAERVNRRARVYARFYGAWGCVCLMVALIECSQPEHNSTAALAVVLLSAACFFLWWLFSR